MMSSLLSWLKSADASTCHPTGVGMVPEDETLSPLSNWTITSGVPTNGLFCSSRSDLLSPSKSFLGTAPNPTVAVLVTVALAVPGASSASVTVTVSCAWGAVSARRARGGALRPVVCPGAPTAGGPHDEEGALPADHRTRRGRSVA